MAYWLQSAGYRNMESMICAVVGRTRHKMVQIEIQEAAKRGAQLIEVRLDFLAKAPDFHRLLDKPPLSAHWYGAAAGRRRALVGERGRPANVAAASHRIRFRLGRFGNRHRQFHSPFQDVKRIVSYHNIREVPEDLTNLRTDDQTRRRRAENRRPRSAAFRQSARTRSVENALKPTVALCMGDSASRADSCR